MVTSHETPFIETFSTIVATLAAAGAPLVAGAAEDAAGALLDEEVAGVASPQASASQIA
jgi:hypothetical protein